MAWSRSCVLAGIAVYRTEFPVVLCSTTSLERASVEEDLFIVIHAYENDLEDKIALGKL